MKKLCCNLLNTFTLGVKMYKTIINFRFWCEHETKEHSWQNLTPKDIREACIKQMTEMSNADVIGSTEIEYDTTEEV